MLNDDGSHWSDKAACRGAPPNLFFPAKDDHHAIATAKRTCVQCPVRIECLDHALTVGEYHGIWGGYLTEERELIRIAKRLPKAHPPEKRFFLHGTEAGYKRHRRYGTPPCRACRAADREARYTRRPTESGDSA